MRSASGTRGESVIALLGETRVVGVIALADRVRPRAKAAVAALKAEGIESVMITGDAEAVAATVADELGIERFHARVLPQDKVARVRELKREGRTAFVGDGINDAPALLEADLGIAIGAEERTFSGLSGIGDLYVTCSSRHGRNLAFGRRIGQGEQPEAVRTHCALPPRRSPGRAGARPMRTSRCGCNV